MKILAQISLFILTLTICSISSVNAQKIGYVFANNLNIRSSQTIQDNILGKFPYGTKINYSKTNNKNWLKVNYNGTVGYISSQYVTLTNYGLTDTPELTERVLRILTKHYNWYNFSPDNPQLTKANGIKLSKVYSPLSQDSVYQIKNCNNCIATLKKITPSSSAFESTIKNTADYSNLDFKKLLPGTSLIINTPEKANYNVLVSGNSSFTKKSLGYQHTTKDVALHIVKSKFGAKAKSTVDQYLEIKLEHGNAGIVVGDWDNDKKLDFYITSCHELCSRRLLLSSVAKPGELLGLIALWYDSWGC